MFTPLFQNKLFLIFCRCFGVFLYKLSFIWLHRVFSKSVNRKMSNVKKFPDSQAQSVLISVMTPHLKSVQRLDTYNILFYHNVEKIVLIFRLLFSSY